ncbi:MAG: DUF1636 domain-containing protein [Phyllobacteriaceae bacterium]|nr:DUF1636 domain-containing protein [Phyllobacteriaceae bacterium]
MSSASDPASPSTPAPLADAPVTVLVCTSCRRDGDAEDGPRAGARLHEALSAAAQGRDDVRIVGVECLSVCKRPVTVGFADPAKWTYVYGEFDDTAAAEILATAALYGATEDGLVPWKQRPTAFKKGVVARIPPFFAEIRR